MSLLITKIIKDNKEFFIRDLLLDSSKGKLYLENTILVDPIDSWKEEELTGLYYVIDTIDKISSHGDITREVTIL